MPQDYSEDSQFDEHQLTTPDTQELPFLSVNFVQQVDELVSLAHYGPSIVLILGEDGIGKTCTLEQLENETTDIGQIRIDGNPMLGIDQLHASFLQQLNNYEQAVEYNSVRDSLLRASEISEQLIIVDDAQQLSTSVLESLLSLVSPVEQSPSVPVRLFLFGNPELKQQLNMDSFPKTAIYSLFLKGFEKDEIAPFLGHQLNLSDGDVEESFGSKSIAQIWKNSHGNPGKIIRNLTQDDMDLDDVEEITRSRWPAIIFRSLLAILGIALLLLALFGEKWLQTDEQQNASEIPVSMETENIQPATTTETEAADTTATIENIEIEHKPVFDLKPQNTQPPENQPLEQSASNIKNKIDNGNNEAQLAVQRVDMDTETTERTGIDIPDSEKSSLPLKQQPAKQIEIKSREELSQVTPPFENSLPPVENENPQTVAPITAEKLSNSVVTTTQPEFTQSENYLLAEDGKHYAVQLLGLSKLEEIERFSKQLSKQLSSDENPTYSLYTYRSLLNGKPWFILVTGNYLDADTARRAKEDFPTPLRKLNPWIKSYAKIQSEIQQAAASRE